MMFNVSLREYLIMHLVSFWMHSILSKFTQLELDLWKAYRILLAGKLDVGCIFQQTHPYSMENVNDILVDALLYGNELKGEEKWVYL